MVKAVAALAVAVVALLATGSAQPRVHAPTGPLGIDGNGTTSTLVRLNARNLRPLPGRRLELGAIAEAWGYSPDRTILAFGLDGSNQCPEASLRFVEVATLVPLGDVSLGQAYVLTADWLAPDRLAVVVAHCESASWELVVVDPSARRVLDRSPLQSGSIRRAGDRLAIVAGNVLTIVDAAGTARSVVLDRIEGGALALTPDGRRAFVVSANGLIADVDTSSLSVAYRGQPTDEVAGSRRYAQVLPTGKLAVAGSQAVRYLDTGDRTRHIGTGLVLIDIGTWVPQRIDYSSARFTVTGDTLLATGSSWGGGGYYVVIGGQNPQQPLGDGLMGYTLSGIPRFHRFAPGDVFVEQIYGKRAFVYDNGSSEPGQLKVVDIHTGKVVGTRADATMPWILQGSSSISR